MGPVIGGSLAQQGQWRWLFCAYPPPESRTRLTVCGRPEPSPDGPRRPACHPLLEAEDSAGLVPREVRTYGLDVSGLATISVIAAEN